MMRKYACLLLLLLVVVGTGCAQNVPWTKSMLLFEDTGSKDWQGKWMLDGQRSQVINSEEGMELIAGPEAKNDTCHTVIWTKQPFAGNICIEYDYTRTDTVEKYVNIIYFMATGKGDSEYPTDIALWNEKRVVPHMSTYFRNMHTYHISYAALTPNNPSGNKDYIRLRRYNPHQLRLNGATEIPEDYFNSGLFKTGVTYHIQVFKFGPHIEMYIQNRQNPAETIGL